MAYRFTYQFFNQLTPSSRVMVNTEQLLGQLVTVSVGLNFESNNPFEAALVSPTGLRRLYDCFQLQTHHHQLKAPVLAADLQATLTTNTWVTANGTTIGWEPTQPVNFVDGQLPLYAVTSTATTGPVTAKTAQALITPGDARVFSAFNAQPQLAKTIDLKPLLTSIQRVQQACGPLFAHRDRAFSLELNNPLVTDLQQAELVLLTQLVTDPTAVHQLNGAIFDALAANDAYCLELQRRLAAQ